MQPKKRIPEELKKLWEQKLKESGFKDIETEVGGERVLKEAAGYAFRRSEATTRDSKLTYFMLLAQFLADERDFSHESDRLIMEWTSEGWSIQEISSELRRLKKPKFNRDTIRYIRRRYETKWGIKIWKPEDMVSRRVRTRS